MTKAKDTILFLSNFNSWRRGNDSTEAFDPAEVGAAIDDAVNLLRRYVELERENAALRSAAVETCAVARVWVTVWGDKFSDASLLRFAELEEQILKEAKP